MDLLTSRAKQQELTSVEPRLIFDLQKEFPEVYRAACEVTAEVDSACRSMRSGFPIPNSAKVDLDSHFFRLPNHNRSFCYRLSSRDDRPEWFETPVIVFKGGEPLMADFPDFIQWLSKTKFRKSELPMIDHFPIREGKIGGIVTAYEALSESRLAAEVQRAYLQNYGTLAPMPTPLFVHAISDDQVTRLMDLLKTTMQARAYDRVSHLAAEGFAMSVYYFPHVPVRSNFFGTAERGLLKPRLKALPNVDETVESWCLVFARLLLLGYLPCTTMSVNLGSCLDPGNSTIFGGLCDIDSVVSMRSAYNDSFFYDSIGMSIQELIGSINVLLQTKGGRAWDCGIRLRVLNRIKQLLVTEKRPGMTLAPQVSYFFDAENSLVDMALNYLDQFDHQSSSQY